MYKKKQNNDQDPLEFLKYSMYSIFLKKKNSLNYLLSLKYYYI